MHDNSHGTFLVSQWKERWGKKQKKKKRKENKKAWNLEPKFGTDFPLERTNLSLRVAEDNSLCNCKCIIKITQSIKFPLFSFNCDKKLLDALSSQKTKKQIKSVSAFTRSGVGWGGGN